MSIVAARGLFFVLAGAWALFCVMTLMRGAETGSGGAFVLAGLMAGNTGLLAAAGWGLGRWGPVGYITAVALVAVNVVLTITDEMGRYDLLVLVVGVALLGLLVGGRKPMLRPRSGPTRSE